MTGGLSVAVTHRQGAFDLAVEFHAAQGVTALFGRSGSGKTTLVNIVGGLLRPQAGRVTLDDRVLVDTERRIWVPPHRRRIGVVFQEGRLLPHLSVRQNLLFGRWFAPRLDHDVVSSNRADDMNVIAFNTLEHDVTRKPVPTFRHHALEADGEIAAVVDLLGIGPLLGRRPAGLSGGEKQRVAIGRALLSKPRLLLMDEPLSALDDTRKAEILPYLERLRDEARVPILYVSHSVAEVARLADTLVVLDAGRVTAAGPAAQVLARLDIVSLAGSREAGAVLDARLLSQDDRYGLTTLSTAAGELRVPRIDLPPGARLRLQVLARDVTLSLSPPIGSSALNVLAAVVAEVPQAGESGTASMEVRLDCSGVPLLARITRRSVVEMGLMPGMPVYAVVKSVALDGASGVNVGLPRYDGTV